MGGPARRLEHLTREIVRVAREIVHREEPHGFAVAVQHRQPADVLALHEMRGVGDVLVAEAGGDIFGHDLPHLHPGGVPPVGDRAATDVTVGDHPQQLAVLHHRQRADVEVAHLARGVLQRRVGADPFDLRGHDFRDLHGCLLFVMSVNRFLIPDSRPGGIDRNQKTPAGQRRWMRTSRTKSTRKAADQIPAPNQSSAP